MRRNHGIIILIIEALLIIATNSWAADLLVSGEINDTEVYDSAEGIVFDDAILKPTANLTAVSTFEAHIKPGTRIQAGARLVIRMKDNDGLSNRCEMTYFGDLTHSADEDPDNDQLTNYQECQLGTNPMENDLDSDADGLPDIWEMQYFGILNNDRNGDADEDGISNWIEYKLGTDPTAANGKSPGLQYEYDQLGRITRIYRIPSQ